MTEPKPQLKLPEGYKIPVILHEIEKILLKREADKKALRTDKTFRHYPSSGSIEMPDGTVVGSCLRKSYYQSKEVPITNPSDFSNLLQREFGNAIHTFLQDALEDSKALRVKTEVPGRVIVNPLTKEMSFRIDGVVNHDGIKGGIEIKTAQGRSLQYAKKEGSEPRQSYSLQVADYFVANPDIAWFSLVIVARDSGFRMEYHYTWEDDGIYVQGVVPYSAKVRLAWLDIGKSLARRATLEKAIETNTVPPRDFKIIIDDDGSFVEKRQRNKIEYKSHYMCFSYCEWRDHCWKQPDAKQDAIKIPGK